LVGRISTGDHDPADLVAGALIGRGVARLVTRVGAPRAPRRRAPGSTRAA
jgi:hypothetical protein